MTCFWDGRVVATHLIVQSLLFDATKLFQVCVDDLCIW